MLNLTFLFRHWRALALACALAAGLVTGETRLGLGLERSLQEASWLMRKRPASGDLHIVEIDAASIAAVDRWPWPRSKHALVIDRLRQAGAASIAFDVDFSARSTPAEDAALAGALERAGGTVVLPTFRQAAGGARSGWIDAVPAAPFRAHAAAAAVTIQADRDGYVRRAPLGMVTQGVPRPSLSAIMAGQSGNAGSDFPIDFAIDPASIPRHSVLDILEGDFDADKIAGKHVLIGATAVEMGDRYVVPMHGVLPGVTIQALAAETLAVGVPREAGWPLGVVLASLLASVILRARSRAQLALASLVAPLTVFALATAAESVLGWQAEIAPALVLLLTASAVASAARLLAATHRRRRHDPETGMPNRLALEAFLDGTDNAGVLAVRIVDFDKLAAALGGSGAGTGELVHRICDRIALLDLAGTIYHIEDRVLCLPRDERAGLEDELGALRALMLNPIEVRGRRVDVGLACGYAQGAALNPRQLVANAVLAADIAQSQGVTLHVHEAADEETIEREVSLLGELDDAIAGGEIEVAYQPKLDLATGRIVSVEALVRWNHPTRGRLAPDLFIPLAEQSDRIGPLTLHVVKQTVADLGTWRAAGHLLGGAVNVSAKLLDAHTFMADLRLVLNDSPIEAGQLTFEVTESAAMHEPDHAAGSLRSFKDLGVRISMDDYGTGQSTLSYLQKLPLDELKIDKSFVRDAHKNRDDGVLVRSTINLAHDLGLKVVAEGVEEPECLAFLRTIGCDLAQGYLIGRPTTAASILDLVNEYRATAA